MVLTRIARNTAASALVLLIGVTATMTGLYILGIACAIVYARLALDSANAILGD